ncbi:MAG: antibiotic biosynthesis monooxygenase [Deltaproteobacteria bacterium]|nr:antibiotic biosynthesis monooxygenase [Deltaproteobacteria bacterium]
MILAILIFNALPEKRKELMQTLLSMFEENGKEKGCLRYNILTDIYETTVFNLIEEWNTREDLNRYLRSERFSIILGTKSLLAVPMKIKIHSVSQTEGIDAVFNLRSQ